MGELLDTLRGKICPTPKPTPNPAKPLSTIDYIRAWKLLKDIPIHKLGPAACSIGFVLFLAISGLFAWIAVILRFMLNIMFMFK